MFSHSSSIINNCFICDKCVLVSSLIKKIAPLELHFQKLESICESKSSIVSIGEILDALCGVSNPPTPALETSQLGKWDSTWQPTHNGKENYI